jgi:organic hydroperoxide reductase OsmC/OhrA
MTATSITTPAKVLYTAKAHTAGCRDPEQLFAAGWSSEAS